MYMFEAIINCEWLFTQFLHSWGFLCLHHNLFKISMMNGKRIPYLKTKWQKSFIAKCISAILVVMIVSSLGGIRLSWFLLHVSVRCQNWIPSVNIHTSLCYMCMISLRMCDQDFYVASSPWFSWNLCCSYL